MKIHKEVNKLIGRVKWFNNDKGFGFIDPGDGSDVYVHHSVICDQQGRTTLMEGDAVRFETDRGIKGIKAINVQRI